MLLDYVFKPFIKIGSIRIIDSAGKTHHYSGRPGVYLSLKLLSKEIERQFLWQPELALGEGYMKGSITLEQGSLYQLLDFASQNLSLNAYRIGMHHQWFYRIAKILSYI